MFRHSRRLACAVLAVGLVAGCSAGTSRANPLPSVAPSTASPTPSADPCLAAVAALKGDRHLAELGLMLFIDIAPGGGSNYFSTQADVRALVPDSSVCGPDSRAKIDALNAALTVLVANGTNRDVNQQVLDRLKVAWPCCQS